MFGQAVQGLGVSAFMLSDIPPDRTPQLEDVHASGWHPDWETRYLSQNFANDDPITKALATQTKPFFWYEAERSYAAKPRSKQVMNEARSEFKMLGGYGIPIRGENGVVGLVSVATDIKNWQLSQRENDALRIISLFAYEAVCKFRKGDLVGARSHTLTRREIDCVCWIAEGKTTWEISMILGISEHTVNEYIGLASQKLGTRNRAHLVARALRLGIIG